ncbi:MAG: hypothetical protein MJ231_00105 [bacterium]|nr:hypothetical protein [bacterium]
MRSYIKNMGSKTEGITREIPIDVMSEFMQKITKRKLYSSIVVLAVFVSIGAALTISHMASEISLGEVANVQMTNAMIASTSSKGVISIPSGMVKANPFVPYRNVNASHEVLDVPSINLIEPPETVSESSEAARIMDTIVSGILYDKYSPSAILNIEGTDYLVKKGDVVNNYKVVNIAQDSVTVKLGNNVYKAGIGEILTDGAMNRNDVANLGNKFGGKK